MKKYRETRQHSKQKVAEYIETRAGRCLPLFRGKCHNITARSGPKIYDEGLLVPGEMVRAAIYERLERSYQVKRGEIPEKLETFQLGLAGLLGKGVKVMGKLIAKNLYSRLGLNFTAYENWILVDYVNHAKKRQASD